MGNVKGLTAAPDEIALVRRAHEAVEAIRHRTRGMMVRMLTGKYAGRLAEVDGAIIGRDGQIQYCCYVLRSGSPTGEVLNTDAASRSYHSADKFEVLP